jgi:hypothetical protein
VRISNRRENQQYGRFLPPYMRIAVNKHHNVRTLSYMVVISKIESPSFNLV